MLSNRTPRFTAGPKTLIPSAATRFPSGSDRFIICGLGSLGQHSIVNLKKFDHDPFEVHITAIDQQQIQDWEMDSIPHQLVVPPIVGDCRREEVLRSAGIAESRAILIVTSDESVNVECAIAARRLNPNIQIILRSSRHSLNDLLARKLGRFVALDATELPAMTFALAGLGDDTVSVFTVGSHQFRVVDRIVLAADPRFDHQPVRQLHRPRFRLLDLTPVEKPQQPMGWATTASSVFHRWQPYVQVSPGDRIAYIELEKAPETAPKRNRFVLLAQDLSDIRLDWRRKIVKLRQTSEQSLSRVATIAFATAIILWAIATLLLKITIKDLSWTRAISAGATLLLGGYGDVFGGLGPTKAPGWVMLTCLLITVTSLLVVLGIFGLLAERLLNSRYDFLQKQPRLPRSNHVVVVGLGRIGRKVTRLLVGLNQSVVAVSEEPHPELFGQLPLLVGDIIKELPAANLATAKSVIAVTDDQMLNLEIALLATESTLVRDRTFSPVVRTRNQEFSQNLAALMPDAQAFCPYALSAEAFAGAAFGENILGLFRLSGQTILIAEYTISWGDTLAGHQLAKIAYGYGVVPILRETEDPQGRPCTIILPTDEQRLEVGDRLFLLSSINGLRRIERGEMTPPRRWQLSADRPATPESLSHTVQLLSQLADCAIEEVQQFAQSAPAKTLEVNLYDYQAAHIIQKLKQFPLKIVPLGIATHF